jgi:hypothetical protein
VTAPRTVAEAFRALDRAPAGVVLDPGFPGGGAGEVVRAVRSRRLPCRLVLSTTAGDPRRSGRHRGWGCDVTLPKPADLDGITRMFGALIDPDGLP